MFQAICEDPKGITTLENGKPYYIFPVGSSHAYVSKFPNKNAHRGCYEMKHFKVIQENEWPQEPEFQGNNLDREKLYKARLIWRRKGYSGKPLQEYYVKSRPVGDCVNFYFDRKLKELGGQFPFHWFTDFVEVMEEEVMINEEKVIDVPEVLEIPEDLFQLQHGQLAFVI